MLYYHIPDVNISHVGQSELCNQIFWVYHVVYKVHYAYIVEADEIDLFQ